MLTWPLSIILIAYYVNATCHSIIYVACQIYQTVYSFSSVCKVFVQRDFYIFSHLAINYCTLTQVALQAVICVERVVATICVRNYEKNGRSLGIFLLLIAVSVFTTVCKYFSIVTHSLFQLVIPILLEILVYSDDTFSEVSITFLNIPTDSIPDMNILFATCIPLFMTALVIMTFLLKLNRRRLSIIHSTLTYRFQTQQNVCTTRFIAYLSFLQLSQFTIYYGLGLTVRVMKSKLFTSESHWYTIFRTVFYLVPLFTFLLPVLSIYLLRKYRLKQEVNFRSIIAMETKGAEGWRNYEEIVITFPIYIIVQYALTVESLLSAILLIFVQMKYLYLAGYHFNIKLLISGYYLIATIHSILLIAFQIEHIIRSYTYANPCDVFLNHCFYTISHLLLVYGILALPCFQFAMSIERFVATIKFAEYETSGKRMGIMLFILSIAIPAISMAFTYEYKDFTEAVVNSLSTPVHAIPSAIILYIIGISLCTTSLLTVLILCLISQRRNARPNASLSVRYQLAENIKTTKFISMISIVQLLIYLAYALIPVFTLLLPILTMFQMTWLIKKRNIQVRSMVSVQAVGEAGWQNYVDMLNKQWKNPVELMSCNTFVFDEFW
uniref:Serpentine receptor class gamma n=1 Tax=Heterorhabditis bacteriophora TaxID=37862 RepID=A0A1I7X7M7_HETBA